MKEYELKITSQRVTKHRSGERSEFSRENSMSEYFFMAHFEFHTGSKIEIMMVSPRKEYRDIPTLEISYADIDEARKKAFQDYQRAVKLISDETFLYSRDKGKYCNIYGRDKTSPTGVNLLGGISSGDLADFVMRELGINGGTLSPTEGMQTAHSVRI